MIIKPSELEILCARIKAQSKRQSKLMEKIRKNAGYQQAMQEFVKLKPYHTREELINAKRNETICVGKRQGKMRDAKRNKR